MAEVVSFNPSTNKYPFFDTTCYSIKMRKNVFMKVILNLPIEIIAVAITNFYINLPLMKSQEKPFPMRVVWLGSI